MSMYYYYCFVALNTGKFKKEYPDDKIAREIAPFWEDVGIQLSIENLKTIESMHNPTDHKFKDMLQKWLAKQTCSEQEALKMLHAALKGLELNRAAEEFYDKALKEYDIN